MEGKKVKIKVGDTFRLRIKSDSFFHSSGWEYFNVECLAYRGSKKYYYDDMKGRDLVLTDKQVFAGMVDEDDNLLIPER